MSYDLNELSPEEIVELGYALNDEMNKEASGGIDLNELAAHEIVDLAYELQGEMDKQASEVDLNDLTADELVELAAYLEDEMDKEASGIDLNDLSVDEFVELAAYLEEDLEKEAAAGRMSKMYGSGKAKALAAYEAMKRGGRRYGELMSAKNVRGNVREVAGEGSKAKAYMDILRGKRGNKMMRSEALKSLAAQGGTAAGVAGVGYGVSRRRRR